MSDDQDDLRGGLTRRELFQIGNVLAMPVLLGGVKAHAGSSVDGAEGPLRAGPDIYQSIGVDPIINCRGTFTIIGGSVERPEVRAAMDAASKHFVQIVTHGFSYFTAINEICSSPGNVSSFRGVRSIGPSCATVVRAGGVSEKYCA